MRFHSAIYGVIAAGLVGVVAAACSGGNGDDEPACLPQPASTNCTPLYEPTFDNVWLNTLKPTCAAAGCHSGSMPTGDMALDVEDDAYTNLLTKSTTSEPRVTPGDVKCGKVIVRLHTKDQPYSMPRGQMLDDDTLCSITQWIANGAKRQ
ncbi:MAG TPA: hypothetical protein VHC69_01070 [Polyangiaceae bacterium]|nr:hypothetical protein [Polyangiaceae bacterium]